MAWRRGGAAAALIALLLVSLADCGVCFSGFPNHPMLLKAEAWSGGGGSSSSSWPSFAGTQRAGGQWGGLSLLQRPSATRQMMMCSASSRQFGAVRGKLVAKYIEAFPAYSRELPLLVPSINTNNHTHIQPPTHPPKLTRARTHTYIHTYIHTKPQPVR
jgi:hypothetical protein